MALLLKLGIRNLSRKKGRSLLTISAVALCSMGIMLYLVLVEGIVDMILDGLIDQIGHHQFVHENVLKEKRLSQGSFFVEEASRLEKEVHLRKEAKTVAPRVDVHAYIDNHGKQAPAKGLGINPIAERNILKINEKIIKGRMLQTKGQEIVLGHGLAKRLHANVGDSLVLIGKTVDDSMSALRTQVVGISRTGTMTVDKMFFISIPSAQYFLDISDSLSKLLVFAHHRDQAIALGKSLSSIQLPKHVVSQNWKQSKWVAQMIPMMNVFVFILGGFVVFIAGVGLMNTMTMSVLERRNEIGIMMALGLSPGKVAGVFLIEGLLLGIVGAIIGVTIAGFASIPLVTNGLSWGTEAVSKLPFPIQETIHGRITWGSIMAGLIVGISATLVGTLWPAIQAAAFQPVDTLRK